MASNKKILANIAQRFDLKFDKRVCIKYGKTPDSISQMNIPFPEGCRASVANFRLNIYMPIKGSNKRNEDALFEALNNFFIFFETRGFRNCDDRGVEGPTDIYKVKGEHVFLGLESASLIRTALDKEAEIDALKEERVLPGLLGALLGAIIGSIVVFLVARLGYVCFLISALMGIAVVYGYKWKGVRLSMISSILNILICTVFSYFVFRLDLALSIYKAAVTDVSIGDCLINSKAFLETSGSMNTYYSNMVLLVGVCFVGAIVTVAFELKNQNEAFKIEKL